MINLRKLKFVVCSLILLSLCLFGCGECEHNWKTDNCDEGTTCTLCGEIKYIEHDFSEPGCYTSATCKHCGETLGEPAGHRWTEAVCLRSQSCTVCKKSSAIVQHDWQNASCQAPKNCARCGITEGKALPHNWLEATCIAPSTCSGCGATEGSTVNHKYKFVSCTENQICSVCQAEGEAPGHKFRPASCTSGGYCTKCDYKIGSSLGHSWQNATCDAPKTCSRCDLTEGEALGHKWEKIETIAPSCSVGKEISKCKTCQEEKVKTTAAIIFYHIANEEGKCTVCNTQFDLSKLTLKSIATSSKYVANEGVFSTTETPFTVYKPITYADLNMPIVDLNGDISKASKTNILKIPFKYNDGEQIIECFIEIKVQGASSAGYAKKNYNIKLFTTADYTEKLKVKMKKGWGKESKYCLKANYVDFSQARNVVSAQIFGDIVASRGLEDELSKAPNGGAIDGFPVLVYNEGDFLGLYTLNIPKDKWMFDMKDSDEKNQAILMAEHWNNSVAFRALMNANMGTSGWELEFASNEESLIDNDTSWVVDSMNRVIEFVLTNDGQKFVSGIEEYVDVDKCIDTMLYLFFICADDNTSKNILWVTYDGKKWFPSVYDMDGTWGMKWNGSVEFNENTHLISNLKTNTNSNYNLLFEKLYINCFERVCQRYAELRKGPLSISNISSRFLGFASMIPEMVYKAEMNKWPSVPSHETNNVNQILSYAEKRLEKFDEILMP